VAARTVAQPVARADREVDHLPGRLAQESRHVDALLLRLTARA
jgi:hypothetical protein